MWAMFFSPMRRTRLLLSASPQQKEHFWTFSMRMEMKYRFWLMSVLSDSRETIFPELKKADPHRQQKPHRQQHPHPRQHLHRRQHPQAVRTWHRAS